MIYKTKIKASVIPALDKETDTSAQFENSVTLKPNVNDTKTITASAKTLTGKWRANFTKTDKPSYTGKDQIYNWTVRYNYREETVLAGTELVDTLSADQAFVDYNNKKKVNIVAWDVSINKDGDFAYTNSRQLVENEDYKVTYNDENNKTKMTIKFEEEQTAALKIEYKSQYQGLVTETNKPKISNKVEVGTLERTKEGTTDTKPLVKSVTGVNYDSKVISWKLTVNNDGFRMNDWKMTDILSPGLSLQEETFKITANGGASGTNGDLERVLPESGEDGYTYNYDSDTRTIKITLSGIYAHSNHKYTIEYKTDFDTSVIDKGDLEDDSISEYVKFFNNVVAKWFYEKTNEQVNTQKKNVIIPLEFRKNAAKSGSYNAVNKKITWTVDVNHNQLPLLNAVLSDKIQSDQSYVENSLEIYKLKIEDKDITAGTAPDKVTSPKYIVNGEKLSGSALNPFTIVEPNQSNGQELKISFPDTQTSNKKGQAYRITFETSLDDTMIGGHQYNNKALFVNKQYGKDIKHNVDANISVLHGGEYATKSGKLQGTSNVDWTININDSQSTINDFRLVDKPSINQVILEDTIAIYGTTIDKAGKVTEDPSNQLAKGKDYLVKVETDFESGQQTLTISFNQTVKTAYRLHYRTEIQSILKNDSVENSVSIYGNQERRIVGDVTKSIEFSNASASAQGVYGSIVLKKQAEIDNKIVNLEGAELTLWTLDGKGNLKTAYRTATTDENGEIKLGNIKPGDYKVTEGKAPAGYSISESLQLKTDENGVKTGGLAVKVVKNSTEPFSDKQVTTIKNDPVKIKITKLDGHDSSRTKLLPGAEYALYQLDEKTDEYGVAIASLTTSSNTSDLGTITIEGGLQVGAYYIVETKAPAGYLIDDTPIYFNIKENVDTDNEANGVIPPIEIVHMNYQGSVKLKKVDGSNQKFLPRATFIIKDEEGTEKGEATTSDTDGTLTLSGLAPGKYTLHEKTAPKGYVLNNKPIELTIADTQAKRTKDDSTYYLDSKGQETIGQPSSVKIVVNETNPTQAVSISSQNYQGAIEGLKVDGQDTSEMLAGAKFSIYPASKTGEYDAKAEAIKIYTNPDTTAVDPGTTEFTTGSNGEFYARGLSVGTYFLVEKEAPTGYLKDTTPRKFKITETSNGLNEPVPVKDLGQFKNYQGSVVLKKTESKNKKALNSAKFKLYYADGSNKDQEVVADNLYTTENDGKLTVDKLAPGKYYFQEYEAPKGYVKSSEKIEFEIPSEAAGKPKQVQTLDGKPFENKLAEGSLKVKKVDSENPTNALAGAKFTLTNDNDKKDVQEVTTKNDGLATFKLEANTTYTLKEIQAPTGFKTADYEKTGITFEKNNGETIEFDVENHRQRTDIIVSKSWDLKGNDQAYLPDSIEISLLKDDNKKGESVTIKPNDQGEWQYTFPQLPVVDLATGKDHVYKIEEKEVTGYQAASTVTVDQQGNAKITNTIATTKISGTKHWDLVGYDESLLPDSLTVKVQSKVDDEDYQDFTRGGKPVTTKVTAKDNWQYDFNDLPTHTGKGEKITYRVVEETVPGFNEDESKRGQEMAAADLTNVLETTEFTIQKNWQDQDNFYQTRPDKLNFELYVKHDNKWQSFEEFFGVDKEIKVTANDQGIWTAKVSGLPKYAKGKVVQYGIKEINTEKTYQSSHADKVQAVKNDVVQVTNELVTTELALTKVWDDLSNQYDTRPATIKVQLLSYVGKDADAAQATGTKNQQDGIFELSGKKDQWQLAVKDLPKYNAAGQKINYLFKEAEAIPGYQATKMVKVDQEGSATITNQLATTEVSGTKHWELSGYSDKILPESITVKLQMQNTKGQFTDFIREGKVLKTKFTAKDQWAYQFEKLPTHNGQGQEIKYRVVEEAVPGYREDEVKRGETKQAADLTNILELTEFTLKKTWDDQENFHNTRPEKIAFELYVKQDNKWQSFEDFFGLKKAITVVADKEGNWETKVTGLPKFVKGEEVQYGIKEVSELETYQSSLLNKVHPVKNQEITVKNSLSTTSLNLTKVWNDFGNYFSTRPASIKVQLFSYVGDNAKTAKAHGVKDNKDGIYELSGTGEKWHLTVNDLAKYTEKGEKIQYFFREISESAAYHNPEDALVDGQGKATLTNNMLKRDVNGQINWDLGDFDEDILPDDVIVKLQSKTEDDDEYTDVVKDGEPQKVVVNEKDDWRYEFTDLPTHNADGEKIIYRVIEDEVPGFTEGESKEETDITDVLELTEFNLQKNWDDQDNFFNTRPEKVNFELFVKQGAKWQSFEDYFGVEKKIELTANDKGVWEKKISGLPKYAKGKAIQYGLKEITETKTYQSSYAEAIQVIDQPEITVTNKLVTTDLTLTKIWADLSNQFKTRPESIELELLSYVGEDVETAKNVAMKDHEQGIFKLTGEEDQWTLSLTGLPKYNAAGQELNYLVREAQAPVGYTAYHEGLTVTNALVETTVAGEKTWEDNEDKLGLRPESITIVLNQNGQEFMTKEVTAKDDWQYQFTNLPKVDEQGEAYNYSISEKEVEHYTTRIVDYNVVNTLKERAQLPQTKGSGPTNLTSTLRRLLPQTGTEIAGAMMMTVIGLGLVVAVVLIYRKRKGE